MLILTSAPGRVLPIVDRIIGASEVLHPPHPINKRREGYQERKCKRKFLLLKKNFKPLTLQVCPSHVHQHAFKRTPHVSAESSRGPCIYWMAVTDSFLALYSPHNRS
jgi:hypothetical protein